MAIYLLGTFSGIIVILVACMVLMPQMGKLFFVKDKSLLAFDETVAKLRENCKADKEWHLLQEKDYNESYQKAGKEKMNFRLVEFKLGNPEQSYSVNCENPAVCTFMPAAIAVVGHKDGSVLIYRKNTTLMGNMFNGVVRKVMRDQVMIGLDKILDEIIEK